MAWKNYASSLEDAQKYFSEARENYKAVKAAIVNPNYPLDLKDAEDSMKFQYEELKQWQTKKSTPMDFMSQLHKNATSHEDPSVRTNCQTALQVMAHEFIKTKPQSFQDALRILTDLGLLHLKNPGKTWDEIEQNATQKELILLNVRKMVQRVCDKLLEDDPNFQPNTATEIAIIEALIRAEAV